MIYSSSFNRDKLMNVLNEVKRNTKYFNTIKEVGDNIMVSCPYHKSGLERKPSCGINIHTLVYHCFTCRSAGTLFDMMEDIYKPLDIQQIKSEREEIDVKISDRKIIEENKGVVKLDYTVGLTVYLQKRKLTHEICRKYLVGYKDDLVVFPIRNLQGEITFYVTRNVNKKQYTLTKDEKPLYGLYELLKIDKRKDYCFVVESPINCLTLEVWGFKAIALMGTGSYRQIDMLKDLPIRQFILCFDGDEAGRKATKMFKENIKNKLVSTVLMYEGKDVNDLTKEEFSTLLLQNNINEEELL